MNRRSFIKRLGLLVGIGYVAPFSLIPETSTTALTAVKDTGFIITSDALLTLDEYSKKFILPATQKLADAIDAEMFKLYM